MSPIILILGVACCASAVALVVMQLLPPRAAATTTAESPAPAGGPVGRAPAQAAPELPALLDRFRAVAVRLSPQGYGQSLRRRLDLAGNPPNWPAARVLAVKGIGLPIGALLGAMFGLHHGGLLLVLAAVGAVLGYFLPDVLIRNAGEKRQAKLRSGLPDALDMLTVCVEAGLGFDAALVRVAQQLDGPLASELARVTQEMLLGNSRSAALRAMAERTTVVEIRAFVAAFVQAAQMGISVGNVLREQAGELRYRRRQWAEEKAQKLPVKILLPLIFCLLPSMFVVILGPAGISIMQTFGALGG